MIAGLGNNKLADQLASMPDQALPRMAQQYKDDAITLSMILSEKNRRDRMRQTGVAQQGAQPQPKVNEQIVAGMQQPMPEDVGIGQLPAGNMNFADGGIVGYADGGLPYDDYTAVPGMETGDLYARAMAKARSEGRAQPTQRDVDEVAALGDPAGTGAAEIANLQGGQSGILDRLSRGFQRFQGEPEWKIAAAEARGAPKPSLTDPNFRRAATPGAMASMPSIAEQMAAQNAPVADTGRSAAPGAEPGIDRLLAPRAGATPAATVGGTAAQRYQAAQEAMGAGAGDRAGIDAAYKAQAEAMRKAAREEDTALEAEIAARGVAGKGKEERLSKREAGMGKQKDELTGLALLEAGLAIMSTPGSLATAIGKGAQTGLKTYGAGLEKLRSAQEKLDEARDQIDELRRNEANMTAKERRLSKNAINRTEVDAAKLGAEAAEKMYGYNREDARAIFSADTQTKLAEMQERGQSARSAAQIAATLNTPDRLVFNSLLKTNNNDPVKALEAFKLVKGDKFDVRSSYADYLKAFAGKEGLTPPMSMGAYAGQFGATLPR